MPARKSSTYSFAEFELQPDERRLLRDGQAVALTPKLFELLELFVSRAGHVISKDELLTALWPQRFVMESNLTKHIWMLRKALGENGEGEGFIETVPKLGYRFTVPVTQRNDAPVSASALPDGTTRVLPNAANGSPSATIPRSSLRTAALAAALFACMALAGWWVWNGRQQAFPWSANPPGTVMAIVEFENLSRNPADAWLGPAFEEMLANEITIGGRLHTVPGEMVRAARQRLPDPGGGGFGPDTLAELRRRLAADYVVSGEYLTSGKSGNSPVRLDFAVQDARNGATVASFTRNGSLSDLPLLITRVAADLRGRLGVKAQNPKEVRLAANARPPTLDVMRRVGFALDALHHYEPARARDELLQAIAQAPDYAPAYAYLSKAWTALGYRDKALAAANQAAANSADLPAAMRLQIDAQDFEARYDWKHAIESLRKLAALQKNGPEVQLELIDVLLSAGKPNDAQAALDTLREQKGSTTGDARIELAAARVAAAREDEKAEQAHAQRALDLARDRDDAGMAADAERLLGVVLTSSDHKKAQEMLSRALADYASVANPRGEASVHRDVGVLMAADDQAKLARAQYEESLKQFQAIGDRGGMASAYSDLATMLWAAGDRDGSEAAVRNVLQIRRETGDMAGEAWALAALGVELTDDRASDEAIAALRQAAALDASIGAHGHRGFSLYSLSDIFRLRGQLDEARNLCAEALAEYARVKDPASGVTFECALIELDRAEVAASEADLMRVRGAAGQPDDAMTRANADMTLGQIKMGRGDCSGALPLFASAERETAQGEMTSGQATAASFTALCAATMKNAHVRDASIARAAALRSRVTEHQEVFQVDINLTEARALSGEEENQAVSALEALADDARNRDWPGWAMEAELAELRVLQQNKDIARAHAIRARIIDEATRKGFKWVIERAGKI